jgi:hypothetical protein
MAVRCLILRYENKIRSYLSIIAPCNKSKIIKRLFACFLPDLSCLR